jgi:hypothetical protein
MDIAELKSKDISGLHQLAGELELREYHGVRKQGD